MLCGLSAGSLCWFAEAVSGFHGGCDRVEGLGLLPFSNTVHYDAEPDRRSAFHHELLEGMRARLRGRGRRRAALRGTELARSSPRARRPAPIG